MDGATIAIAANNIRADGAIEAMARDDPAAWMDHVERSIARFLLSPSSP